jgi:heme-degrading monooxygenase HmoA
MSISYQVRFVISPQQMGELTIGSSLERTLSYLRALLPNEPGFVSARAMRSLDREDGTEVMIETVWQNWADLATHRRSALAEEKVLVEFEPHVKLTGLTVHIYDEVE